MSHKLNYRGYTRFLEFTLALMEKEVEVRVLEILLVQFATLLLGSSQHRILSSLQQMLDEAMTLDPAF